MQTQADAVARIECIGRQGSLHAGNPFRTAGVCQPETFFLLAQGQRDHVTPTVIAGMQLVDGTAVGQIVGNGVAPILGFAFYLQTRTTEEQIAAGLVDHFVDHAVEGIVVELHTATDFDAIVTIDSSHF